MRKRILSTLLALCMALSLLPSAAFAVGNSTSPDIWDGSVANSYAGGSGTSSSPYLIATAEQLARVAEQVNSGAESGKYYKLSNDIYLNDTVLVDFWDSLAPQNQWTPIGSSSSSFSGNFDGAGYIIYGLYISTGNNYQGLFGSVAGGSSISNLGVEESYVKGGIYVGGICGYSVSGFTACHNEATVIGNNYIGGIAGFVANPGGLFGASFVYIKDCYNTGEISGESYVGGVLGDAELGSLSGCYNVGTVQGTNRIGGIAGRAISSSNCWNWGEITGTSYVGGILGEASFFGATSSDISSCFNAGDISGSSYVGGIIGYSNVYSGFYPSTIQNCYNIGAIAGTDDYIGGIAGQGYLCKYINCYNAGTCSFGTGDNMGAIFNYGARGESTNCYYLEGCCGKNYFNSWSSVVTEKTSDEMQAPGFVSTLGSAWLQDTQEYNLGYPILSGIDYEVYYRATMPGQITVETEYPTTSVGNKVAAFATIPYNKDLKESDIVWTSSNEKIATIVPSYALIEGNLATAAAIITGVSEGTAIITVSVPDGRIASCEVTVEAHVPVAGFDLDMYRADKLLDNSIPTSSTMQTYFSMQTPCEIYVPLLQESGFESYADAWKAISVLFDTIDSPSSVVDFVFEEKDMYSAVILNILEVSTSFGLVDSSTKRIKDAKSWTSELKTILKTTYDIDVTTGASFNNLSFEEQKTVQRLSEEYFKSKYPDLTAISKKFTHLGTFMSVANSIETYVEKCVTAVELVNIDESIKAVIHAMYAKCPDNLNLRLALLDCIEIIDSSTEELEMKLCVDFWSVVGEEIAGRLIDELWKDVKAACNAGFPALDILMAGYKTGKFVSNTLFKTDSTIEQYCKMLTVIDVEDLIEDAYKYLENQYQTSQNAVNARAYLSSVDVMFSSLDQDCVEAYKFVDILDDALANRIGAVFDRTGADQRANIKNSVDSIQRSYTVTHESILTSWINYLDEDFPGSRLYEQYRALFTESLGRIIKKKYVASCPVDVYVYDNSGNLVACVIDNEPSCFGNITVVVEDDIKTLFFYDDEEYRIEYIGNNQGSMNIAVTEYSETGSIQRNAYFYDVPLNDGLVYKTEVSGGSLGSATYYLIDEDNRPVEADLDTYWGARNKHVINVKSGSMIIDGELFFEAEAYSDEQIDIYAYVPEGYVFEGWNSDIGTGIFTDSTSYSTTVRVPDRDITIWAILRQVSDEPPTQSYSLTVINGSGSGDYAAGAQISIEANAASEGKVFDQWITNNGGTFADATSASTTFTMPANNVTVTATYKDITTPSDPKINYMITVNASPSKGGSVTGSGTYNDGQSITVRATPASGYRFAYWAEDGVSVSTNAAYTFTVTANRTLTAVFERISSDDTSSGGGSSGDSSTTSNPSHQITVPTTSNGTVTVTPKSASSGAKVTITAILDDGYTTGSVTVTGRNGRDITITDNGDGTYTFTMPNNQVTVSVTFVLVQEDDPSEESDPWVNPFTDVFESDWFYDNVAYVAQHGLMNGVGDQKFDPSGATTRGMIMTILARMAGVDTIGGTGRLWYQPGMEWAMKAGVSDGTNPEMAITREQFATMLWRYVGEPVVTGDLSAYPDVGNVHADWAGSAMIWAVQKGIIRGSDGRLNPQDNATRAEAAVMLTRFCQYIEK